MSNSYKWPLMRHREISPTKFNPHPPGSIIAGSGTDLVLSTCARFSRPGCRCEIMRHTGLGRGCVGWALRRIICEGLVGPS